MDLYKYIDKQLASLTERQQLRQLNCIAHDKDGHALWQGRVLLDLSSNDYLGLAGDTALRQEFLSQVNLDPANNDCYALAAGSSRLLTGNHPGYQQLEAKLSSMYENRSALVFNSGYHANVGILPALAARGDLICCDKLNHASIIDGAELSGAKVKRYRHLDYDHLEEILAKNTPKYRHTFIVTESVFSMDGDIADLRRLTELKQKYNAVLIVDEAHAFGVYGQMGCGICQQQGVIADIDIIVITFGKALCSQGAAAIMNEKMRSYLVNKMRSLIFTTALAPLTVSWTSFVLDRVMAMTQRREHLAQLTDTLRRGLLERGYESPGSSHIVPLLLGANERALALAEQLRNAGVLVFAIRPPTVPFGTARLRFSLTASLTTGDIDEILKAL
ncbi:MAG: 8-amino-7-oxononanoate synthase [Sedimentisphaerales bacterium]|nr:8-amino-7-oxononanoate synthase [Sedimentisphaerales bacterium]